MENPERRGLLNMRISRRSFVTLVVLAAGASAFYGWWDGKNENQKHEKKMNGWEPKVANLLSETIESERLDNLNTLNDLSRPQFIDLVSKSQNSLLSPNPESSKGSRYDLLAFVLGQHYQLKIPAHNEGPKTIPAADDSLSFLDRTIGRVAYDKIRGRNLQNQANMWIEAVYRSYAAAFELDPTMKDGVYIPEIQSLYGRVFTPRNRFVRLQSHPQS